MIMKNTNKKIFLVSLLLSFLIAVVIYFLYPMEKVIDNGSVITTDMGGNYTLVVPRYNLYGTTVLYDLNIVLVEGDDQTWTKVEKKTFHEIKEVKNIIYRWIDYKNR